MKSTTPIIRPLKVDDLPIVLSTPQTGAVRGYVAELDGEVLAVMGVMNGVPPVAFTEILDARMRKYPKVMVQALHIFVQMLEDHYTFVVAAASLSEQSTFRILERAGFKQYNGKSEEHRGLFSWQPSRSHTTS